MKSSKFVIAPLLTDIPGMLRTMADQIEAGRHASRLRSRTATIRSSKA
jgi:hypothetical protein